LVVSKFTSSILSKYIYIFEKCRSLNAFGVVRNCCGLHYIKRFYDKDDQNVHFYNISHIPEILKEFHLNSTSIPPNSDVT